MRPELFVAWVRSFLALPQLTRLDNAQLVEGLGYEAERCLTSHLKDASRMHLDVFGNHANSACPSAAGGLGIRHRGMQDVVNTFAERAGCEARRPRTHLLLKGQFSQIECNTLFQKAPTKAQTAENEQLLAERELASQLPRGPDKERALAVLRQRCVLAVRDTSGGLEVDNHILDPFSTDEIIVDVTCIHPTCGSRLPAELRHTKEKIESARKARLEGGRDRLRKAQGAAVKAQTTHKHTKYAPLMAIMEKQKADKIRTVVPRFYAACMSTYGELGKETIELTEWLTRKYGERLDREADDDDGIARATKTAQYRREFRVAMLTAVAKGQAEMLLTCGLPWRSRARPARVPRAVAPAAAVQQAAEEMRG
jgi:hypothetical protein